VGDLTDLNIKNGWCNGFLVGDIMEICDGENGWAIPDQFM